MADNDLELCAEWAATQEGAPPDAARLAALSAEYLALRKQELTAKADLDAAGHRALAAAREQARREQVEDAGAP